MHNTNNNTKNKITKDQQSNNNTLSSQNITKTQMMQILYKDLQETYTDFYNSHTFDHSRGYIKGKEDIIRKVEVLLQQLKE